MSAVLLPRRRAWRGLRTATVGLVVALAAGLGTNGASATTPKPRFGPVIDLVTYDGQTRCDPRPKVGVLAFRAFVRRNFGAGDLGISRACDSGGTSEHKEGRAWDAAYNYANPAQRANAERLIAWLLAPDQYGNRAANAKRLGVMYMIWHRHIWAPYAESEGWRPYLGPDPHNSHIHLSFTWDGALKKSTWYTSSRSFLDPYEQWAIDHPASAGDVPGDALEPILTVHPVDSSPSRTAPVTTSSPTTATPVGASPSSGSPTPLGDATSIR